MNARYECASSPSKESPIIRIHSGDVGVSLFKLLFISLRARCSSTVVKVDWNIINPGKCFYYDLLLLTLGKYF